MYKKFLLLTSVLLASLLISNVDNAYSKKPTPEQMLFSSAQGREFWIAIPPNEADGQPLGNTNAIAIEIYVTSSKNCTVSLEIPGMGIKVTKPVTAMQITTFSSIRDETSFQWEVRQSEVPLDMGIYMHAEQPISVYVLNHRNVSSDGYLAIPITACGTDYIHLGYYDFYENLAGGEARGSGFIICAAEDNTKCNIQLNGRGGELPLGRTLGDHKIGDRWSITLMRGQIYCVMGNGLTRGQFDISGSRVISSKPVGFISFHKRTLIPSYDLYNGRNPLMEMIPPVTAWGKKYCTVEYKRKDHGDFFRIIASQDNTTFKVKWYEASSGKLIGQRCPEVLKKSGDFEEYMETYVPQGQANTQESIRGTSVFEADKPVLVIQYSYSTDWDNAPEFDPFMILVVPVEQFIPSTVFQTPDYSAQFLTNYFNIVAIGDTTDPNQTLLKSIKMDNDYVWQLQPAFIFNRIPTTNLYWAKLYSAAGAHHVYGDTKFGGYIYGFSSADGYGWPAAMAINKVDETDTLPPVLTRIGDCGDFYYEATELRNGKLNDDPRQVDQGVYSVEIVDGDNYRLVFPDDFKGYPPVYDTTFSLLVIDKSRNAYAYFQVTDRAGNTTLDSVFYVADKISLNPNDLDFQNVRVSSTKNLLAVLKNNADSTVHVKLIKLEKGSPFSIIYGSAPPEFDIMPQDTHHIWVSYTPTVEGLTPSQKDRDSIEVDTQCGIFKWPVEGRGVIPKIRVVDWDAGAVQINKTRCIEENVGNGLQIDNIGTDTLIITKIDNVAPPFTISNPTIPPLPITIPPGGTIFLSEICFTPPAVNSYQIDVTFESNAIGVDSVSRWTGRGIQPGPIITSKDWQHRRVKTINDSSVSIRNTGSSPVHVTDVKLQFQDQNFQITSVVPAPIPGSPVILVPQDSGNGTTEIVVNVRFTPQKEFDFNNAVIPEFDPGDSITPGSVVGDLKGFGILPHVTITGYEFQPPILVGTTHPNTGTVVIKSTSQTSDLYIDSIFWAASSVNPGDFSFVTVPPSKIMVPMGDSLVLPVQFKAGGVNLRIATVEALTDADVEGPFPILVRPSDTVVIGHGYDQGITVDSINYGNVLLCNLPIKQFIVKNVATVSSANVDSVVKVEGYGEPGNFDLLTTMPQTIGPNGTLSFDVRFHPTDTVLYKALLRVYTSVGSDYYVLLIGKGYNVAVEFSLQKHTAAENLSPASLIHLNVSIRSTNGSYADASIKNIHIEILYNTAWMKYHNVITKGAALDNTWNTITATEVKIDDKTSKLVIDASGTTAIGGDGVVLIPDFTLMLSDAKEFVPTVDSASLSVKDRDQCVIRTSVPGYVIINTCVINLRGINISQFPYSLQEVEPNPVTGNSVEIKYSVGLTGSTKIEVFNSVGNMVAEVLNREMDAGNYQTTLLTDNLSSGVYHIRITSCPFTDSKTLVISK